MFTELVVPAMTAELAVTKPLSRKLELELLAQRLRCISTSSDRSTRDSS